MDHNDNPGTPARESFLALLLAALFGGGFLFFLILVSGGFFLYVLGAVAGIILLGFFHYAVWGFALSQEVAGEREEEEARARREAGNGQPRDQIHIRRL